MKAKTCLLKSCSLYNARNAYLRLRATVIFKKNSTLIMTFVNFFGTCQSYGR